METLQRDFWDELDSATLAAWFLSLEVDKSVRGITESIHGSEVTTDNGQLIDLGGGTDDEVLQVDTLGDSCHILDLPVEVHIVLFEFLCPVKSTCLGLTCKAFYSIHKVLRGTQAITLLAADADIAVPLYFLLAGGGWRSQNYICDNERRVFHTKKIEAMAKDLQEEDPTSTP